MSNGIWKFKTGGIPDDLFVRGQVPMTKAEVRAVTIAKARLTENHVIWDIGAGTGSISVEAGLTAVQGQIHAVEKETDAVELIKENIKLFATGNVTVYHGTAPDVLLGLPQPDRVFIGGSGGNFEEIMRFVHEKLNPGGRVVVNAIVLETLIKAVDLMKSLSFDDMEITQVNISKTAELGRLHMLKSHNPIFVISGQKGEST